MTSRLFTSIVAAMSWLVSSPVSAEDVPLKKDSNRAAVFEPTKIWNVRITLSQKEYDGIQTRGGFMGFGAPGPKTPPPKKDDRELHRNRFGVDLPWGTASIRIDGETFENVGIRYKGNGTIADASRSIKKSFKIDMDRNGGTAMFQGIKTLNLHSGVADPSKTRETLGYSLFRAAGVPAARTTFAEVRITVPGKHDDELLGLYTMVEQVDKTFLRDFFGNDQGLLLKPEGVRELTDLGDDWARYKALYLPKREPTADEIKRLIAFIRLVQKGSDEAFHKQIESFMDVDGYLRYLATTAFEANSDSFFALGHNYYMYLNPKTGKIHYMPWDLDRSFANLPVFGSNNMQMNLSMTHPYGGPHRLTDRLMAMPQIAGKYQTLLKDLSATCFAKDRVLNEIRTIETAIKEPFGRDQKAAKDRKETPGAFGPLAAFGPPPTLEKFVEKRTKSVSDQLAGKTKGHLPSGGIGPGAMMKLGDFMVGPMMDSFDTDKDDMISKEEWFAIVRRLQSVCPKDANGRINEKSVGEGLTAMFPKSPEGTPPPPPGFSPTGFMAGPIIKRSGPDKDGTVSVEQMNSAAEKVFAEFDKSKTGRLEETAFADMLTAIFPVPNFGPPKGPLPKKESGPERKKP